MRVEEGRLTDDAGRTLLLRGCCLGGDSKYPALPDGHTRNPDGLAGPGAASFVGRPFPAEEADEHFGRLSSWGFNFVRLVVTWEAVEHAGPGLYDEAYLAYLRKILKKAEEYGISVYIDPHQDVWSRWTGGDGAPAWTLEKVGFDLDAIGAAGAAVTQQAAGDGYALMSWSANYSRYAAATMFTLFFGGDVYAPGFLIDGEGAQEWLQSRYIAAMRHAFRRLKDCKAIVGWGAMNEPHPGFIGCRNLNALELCPYAIGPVPTPFQAMAAASGIPTDFPVYRTGALGRRIVGRQRVNAGGVSLFGADRSCPWKGAGVWTAEGGSPRLLAPGHFSRVDGRQANFADDFLKPFIKRFASVLREVRPETLIFIEGVPNVSEPTWTDADGAGFVNAVHWYDDATLVTKKYRRWLTFESDRRSLVLGRRAVPRSFAAQLSRRKAHAVGRMGGMPVLLGEFGLPFDLDGGRAYRDGDYSVHEEALSAYYDALDANLLNATIWNYSASNTNERGDGWNGEDLSIWSRDGGPRAIAGWRRPYPRAVAGRLVSLRWDRRSRALAFSYEADPSLTAPTEIRVPPECFGGAFDVRVSPAEDASVEISEDGGLVTLRTGASAGTVEVLIEGR